jgi:hypothetical protein
MRAFDVPVTDERAAARARARRGHPGGRQRDGVPASLQGYNLLIVSEWLDPRDTDRNVAWARETY